MISPSVLEPLQAKTNHMKIVLCATPQDIGYSRELGELPYIPKSAMISIMSWMKKNGYVAGKFYDIDAICPTDREIYAYFKKQKPVVVGISAVVSTSYLQTKNISKIIRKACPKALIILGGYMASSAHVLLRKTSVDICVLGNGEIPFINLLNYVTNNGTKKNAEDWSKIRGLAFLDDADEMRVTGYGEAIPAHEISFPDYDFLGDGLLHKKNMTRKFYFRDARNCTFFNHDARTFEPHRKTNIALFWTTKGCVARCTFCQRFSGGYHTTDLEKMEVHMKELKEKYDVGFIALCDENFGSNKEHAYGFARLMKKYDMMWMCGGVRCTSFTKEDINFFRENNCTSLKFGVESGSQRILNIMEKRFTINNVKTALRNAQEAGLYSPLGLCLAMPGESNKTIMDSGKFVGEMARLQRFPPCEMPLGLFYAFPMPGTPLYEYGQLMGVFGKTPEEEEEYLTYISDKSTDKNNYINLSGSSLKDALFWDYMVLYEAMRTYHKKPLDSIDKNNHHIHNTNVPYPHQLKKIEKRNLIKRALKTVSWKSFKRYATNPCSYLTKVLTFSKVMTKVPRPMIYPILRNLIYAEYKTQVLLGIRKPWKRTLTNAVTIGDSESLREVCARLNKEMMPVPDSMNESNRRLLLLGK